MTSEYADIYRDLRCVVQIQQVSSTPDAYGQPRQIWTTLFTTFAKVIAITDGEYLQAGALTSQVTHEITLNYSGIGVQAGMRVAYGTHYYKVQTVENPKERNRFLRLRCLELNATE